MVWEPQDDQEREEFEEFRTMLKAIMLEAMEEAITRALAPVHEALERLDAILAADLDVTEPAFDLEGHIGGGERDPLDPL